MTLIKSLKYPPNIEGKETIRKHRIHQPKKNRCPYVISRNCSIFKERKRKLEEEELIKQLKSLK